MLAMKNLYIVDNTTICLNTVLSLGGRSDSLFGFEMLSTVVIILEFLFLSVMPNKMWQSMEVLDEAMKKNHLPV